ncbi:MAG: trypsin-like peptidase domain-containing protein [Pirellulaceae bacterium]
MSRAPITCLQCGNSIAGVNPRYQAAAVVCPYCGNQIALQRSSGGRVDLGMLVMGGAALMLLGAVGCVLGLWFLIASFNSGPTPPALPEPTIYAESTESPANDNRLTSDGDLPRRETSAPFTPTYPRPDTTTRIEPASQSIGDTGPLSVAPLVLDESAQRYKWRPDQSYRYRVSVTFESAGRAETVRGAVTYRLGQPDVRDPSFARYLQTGQSSGTGFVVHSDGYLLTCAHVVLGATDIRVELNGLSYPGQVVALDKEHDLAVVHIDRRDLPTLPLGNSDFVQLAEDLHVVGYPLSNVLGESVKTSRGQLAGVIGQGGGKMFQLDAAVNHGNSGGPVINNHGEVVGVATAVLVGEGVNHVGFAVPSAEARRLLSSKGIPYGTNRETEAVPATELMRRVTPAVALLKVTTGPGGVGSAERHTLLCEAKYDAFKSPTNSLLGQFLEGLYAKAPTASARLLTDEFGEVLASHETPPLPFLLGPPERLIVHPLDPKGQSDWTTRRLLSLSRVTPLADATEIQRYAGARFFREIPNDDPFFGQAEVAGARVSVVPLAEQAKYRTLSRTSDREVINLHYDLKSVSDDGIAGVADLHIIATGEITFDAQRGVPLQVGYTAEYREIRSGRPVSVRMTVACSLEDESTGDTAAVTPEGGATVGATVGTPDAAGDYAPPTDENQRVTYLLQVLRERKSDEQVNRALVDLGKVAPVAARRAEVAALIELYLTRDDILEPASQLGAMIAIGVWGDKSNTIRVRAAWSDEEEQTALRQAIVVALARFRAIDELVELLDATADAKRSHFTRDTLIALGSDAEPAAIALARHKNRDVKMHGLVILRHVGGQKTADAWPAIDAQLPGEAEFQQAKQAVIDDVRPRLLTGKSRIAPRLPLLFPSQGGGSAASTGSLPVAPNPGTGGVGFAAGGASATGAASTPSVLGPDEVARFPSNGSSIEAMMFSPDGGRLAVSTSRDVVVLLDLTTRRPLASSVKEEAMGDIHALAFSRDGTRIVAGGSEGLIKVYRVELGGLREISSFAGHFGRITALDVHPDGRHVLSADDEKTLRYWEIERGREVASLTGFRENVLDVRIAEDGAAALATDGATLKRFDLPTGRAAQSWPLDSSRARQAAFSADGSRLVTAEFLKLHIWDAATGRRTGEIDVRSSLARLAVSRDGKWLVTAGSGRSSLSVWNLETRARAKTFELSGFASSSSPAAIAPDNRFAAGVGEFGRMIQVFRSDATTNSANR